MNKDLVNPELRSSIMHLIYKTLNGACGKTMFYANSGELLLDAHPIRTANRPIVFSKSQKKVEVLSIEFNLVSMLNYRLIFEDGEPSIIIQSNVKSIVEKETVVKNWIGWEKDVVTHYKNEVSTNITCGHISFTLTRDEHQALIKKTQEVNQKNEQLARELQDRTIAEKINRRLQGNLNKIEKDDI